MKYMKAQLLRYLTLMLLIVTVVSCEDDATTPPQASAGFTVNKATAGIGEEILFTNTSANATAFKWSFGDGTTSKEISPKKVYSASGTYIVTLLSTGAGGSTLSSTEINILPDPELFYIEAGSSTISHFGLSAPDKASSFLDITGFSGVGLAYDAANEKVYFSDFESYGDGKIWRINLDGTDLEEIIGGLYDPYQIALDVAGGKIYWAEDGDADDVGHIGRANLDGTGREYVVTLDGAQFRAISLDVENNKMYYYEVWDEDLWVANLDGTDQNPIISGVWGYAVCVDTQNDKIYFHDHRSKLLLRADLDGGNVETVDDNGSRIYGISVDYEKGKLYWSGRDSGEIRQANLDGSHKITLKSGLASPRGLFFKK